MKSKNEKKSLVISTICLLLGLSWIYSTITSPVCAKDKSTVNSGVQAELIDMGALKTTSKVDTHSKNDHIQSLVIDGDVQRDGSVIVHQKLACMFNSNKLHQFALTFPHRFSHEGQRYSMKLAVFSVTDETGGKADFEVVQANGATCINIGNHGKALSGKHTYSARYRITGAITAHEAKPDTLCLDIAGTVPMPVDKTEISLRTASGVPLAEGACLRSDTPTKVTLSADGARLDCDLNGLAAESRLILTATLDPGQVDIVSGTRLAEEKTEPKPQPSSPGQYWLPYLFIAGGVLLVGCLSYGLWGRSSRTATTIYEDWTYGNGSDLLDDLDRDSGF
jgi:hypothetical protein